MPGKAEEIPRFKYPLRTFHVGQKVMARNFRQGAAWIPGEILRQLGPLTFLVDVAEGRLWKSHVDHVKDVAVLPCEYEMTPTLAVGPELPEPEPSPSPLASVPEPTPASVQEGKTSETA